MVIDDLIEMLQNIRAEHGNIDVAYCERDDGWGDHSISDQYYFERETLPEYDIVNGVPIKTDRTRVDVRVVLT